MSRPITLTENLIVTIQDEFLEQLKNAKMFDGKFTFSKNLKWKKEEKAKLIYTPVAFIKMVLLINAFSDEVAWHGIVHRSTDSENTFIISDILVYPQEVTGATVNTDQTKYQNWLMGLDDDRFNNLRMQGHSHVNMGVSPSSVDETHQEAILAQLDDTMFYIFMIWNKSFKHNIKIYDMKNNSLYLDDDIEVTVAEAGFDFDGFMSEAQGLVCKKNTAFASTKPDKKNEHTGTGGIYDNRIYAGLDEAECFHNGYFE